MKKMRKALAIVIAAVLALGIFSGCGGQKSDSDTKKSSEASAAGSSSTAAETTGTGETADVAVIVRNSDMYGAWLKIAFESVASDYPEMNVTVFDNQDDPAKHLEIIDTVMQQGYDYLLVQGRQEDLSGTYQKVKDAGIKIMGFNFEPDWAPKVMHTILCDDFELGKIIAEDAAEKLPENAQICILNGPAGISVSEQRREGFQAGILDARPDITLLDEQDAGFVKDTAMNKTSDWLQVYDQIDAIICASDSMAVGAIEAYKANNVDTSKTLFYGIDGLTEACQSIVNGDLTASALQDATLYATTALGMVKQDMAGEININEMTGDNSTTLFEAKILDSSNAQEQYDMYEKYGMVK